MGYVRGDMRVLLVEDDPVCAKAVESALQSEGGFCDTVTSGDDYASIVAATDSDYYDLVILDIHLPGHTDGYDVLVRLRNAKVKVPVLILSGMSSTAQKVKGLNFGADDYLTKPFHKVELLARLRAIIRRTRGHSQSMVQVGNIVINFDRRVVEVKGRPVHLTNKEYGMIELLALRKGTVLTKEMFLNHLYNGPDEPSDNKIVDVFMCKLRRKLTDANEGKSHIETVWGRGYVLKDHVESDDSGIMGSGEGGNSEVAGASQEYVEG